MTHINSVGEKISVEERGPIRVLVIWDDEPPLGSGVAAPMLLDESTVQWLLEQLR